MPLKIDAIYSDEERELNYVGFISPLNENTFPGESAKVGASAWCWVVRLLITLTSFIAQAWASLQSMLRRWRSHQHRVSRSTTVRFTNTAARDTQLKLLIDSGATSACISKDKIDLVKVTNHDPKDRVRVANGSTLKVVAIGDLTLNGLPGFRIDATGARVPTTTGATWHHVLVVDGLDPQCVLLSVKRMRDDDNILTYFNSDNDDKVSDCLRLPSGVYVPFSSDRFEIHVPMANNRGDSASLVQRERTRLQVHAALCHAGQTRVGQSDITVDGRPVRPFEGDILCRGCAHGGTRKIHRLGFSTRPQAAGEDGIRAEFFGQEIHSDTSTGFPKSFPHGFTGMVNFCDIYSGDRDYYCLIRPHDPTEVASALKAYHNKHKHRLKDEKIWKWRTDNGSEFSGDAISGPGGVATELTRTREFSVANEKNKNPVAERAWGVIQRGIRTCLAHASAPDCLWPWAANQCCKVYHHLATTVHTPPKSAFDFLNPERGPADLSWARTMFCDVVVALPERDVYNKVCYRTTVGCHLGYDDKRRGHFVYCPKERRLGTYKVLRWHEDSFEQCKGVSADTPVEYHNLDDLQHPPVTSSLLPKFIRRRTELKADQASETTKCTGVPLYPRDETEQLTRRRTKPKADQASETTKCTRIPLYPRDETEQQLTPNPAGETDPPVGRLAMVLAHEASNDDDRTLLWVPDGLPTDAAYAVGGTAGSGEEFPRTVAEARGTKYWPLVKDALESEIKGKFVENQAWEVVPRPKDRRVVKSKWVLRFFKRGDGSIERVKARLVACGYSQVKGQDYTEVFAATLSAKNFRLFCCLIGLWDWETDQIDAIKAFTQSNVDAVIYVEMPEGFTVRGYVLKLKKALEGIKQGAHLWFNMNRQALTKLGFKSSLTEPNLYLHERHPIIVAVFVDDIVAGFHRDVMDTYVRIKEEYGKMIKIGDLSIQPVHKFIGVEINRDRERGTITLTQTGYIKELAERFKDVIVESYSPTGPGRSASEAFDKLGDRPPDDEEAVATTEYLQLVGSVLWPANMTRPDIAYYCSKLATFSQCATKTHAYYARCVMGYLVKTAHLGITYGGRSQHPMGLQEYPPGFVESMGLHTYHDSSWGRQPQPFGGHVVMLNNGAVHWSSRRLKIVPGSTAEAETAVASRAGKDTVAVRMVLEDMGAIVRGPTPMLGDCKASRDVIVKPGSTQRTNYFERTTLLIKRLYMLNIVNPVLIRTDEMVADCLTKSLDRSKLAKFRSYMLNQDRGPGSIGAMSGTARRVWRVLRDLL